MLIFADSLRDSELAHLRWQAAGDGSHEAGAGSVDLQFGQFDKNDRLVVAYFARPVRRGR
jgi:hypothetical protein